MSYPAPKYVPGTMRHDYYVAKDCWYVLYYVMRRPSIYVAGPFPSQQEAASQRDAILAKPHHARNAGGAQ